jgi:hypothetical protein
MNVEQFIKSRLDGKFFRLDAMGHTTVKAVPLDHIPDHKPVMLYDIVPCDPNYVHHNVRPWTLEEDDTLVEMRGRGERWESIAKRLKRALSSLRMRYQAVCAARGIEMVKIAPGKPHKLTPEIKAEIVRMRDLGMTYTEINKQLGLGGYTARDYYVRHKGSKRGQTREAA